ncbi:hypothetical protein L6R52_28430, partial [Myxococcota bacterium]|nr:hypothetical protein [Myxococcota bacterium]
MKPLVVCSLIVASALLATAPALADRPAAGSPGGPRVDPKDAEIARLRVALERALEQRASNVRDRSAARHGGGAA